MMDDCPIKKSFKQLLFMRINYQLLRVESITNDYLWMRNGPLPCLPSGNLT